MSGTGQSWCGCGKPAEFGDWCGTECPWRHYPDGHRQADRIAGALLALSRVAVWMYLEGAAQVWLSECETVDQARGEVFANEHWRLGRLTWGEPCAETTRPARSVRSAHSLAAEVADDLAREAARDAAGKETL